MAADITEALATALSMEVAVNEWDASPSLLVLYQLGGEVAVGRFDFSEEFWTMTDPVSIVFVVARALSVPDHPPVPVELPEGAQVIGLGLFSESWALDLNDKTDAERKKAQAFTQKHGVGKHPDRKELKMIAALDAQGVRYYAGWMRGHNAPTLLRSDETEQQLDGRGFDALGELLPLVLQEVTP